MALQLFVTEVKAQKAIEKDNLGINEHKRLAHQKQDSPCHSAIAETSLDEAMVAAAALFEQQYGYMPGVEELHEQTGIVVHVLWCDAPIAVCPALQVVALLDWF